MKAFRWLDRRIAAPGPYLTLCLHEHEFRSALRKLGEAYSGAWVNKGAQATMHYLDGPRGDLCCIVCIDEWQGRKPVQVAGLLVHESVHIWQQYCRRIGETNPGDEQEAYAVQSIAQELMAEFARRMEAVGR